MNAKQKTTETIASLQARSNDKGFSINKTALKRVVIGSAVIAALAAVVLFVAKNASDETPEDETLEISADL